jgi:guanyl-specific ribonuclease Sa
MMVNFLLEHNIAMNAMDHFSDLCKKMFPDSKLAKDFSCKRTKSTCVAKELGSNAQTHVAKILKSTPFTITTDGSAD